MTTLPDDVEITVDRMRMGVAFSTCGVSLGTDDHTAVLSLTLKEARTLAAVVRHQPAPSPAAEFAVGRFSLELDRGDAPRVVLIFSVIGQDLALFQFDVREETFVVELDRILASAELYAQEERDRGRGPVE